METEVFLVELPDWPVEAGPMPREMRTPHTEAVCVLAKLDEWAVKTWGFEVGEFTAKLFVPLWENNTDPDEEMSGFSELCDRVGSPILAGARIAAALCARAFREHSDGDITIAWSYALDAESWYGTLLAGHMGIEARRDEKSKMAKSGADARHVDGRANKDKVFAWCDENMKRFSSMDDAAADIAETFVPEKFRAVRQWMTNWKKLRSASTP